MNNQTDFESNECAFAERLITVLYEEAEPPEEFAVREHLKMCALCQTEFGSFSKIKFSLDEWRENEFVPLELPQIVLPFKQIKISNPAPQKFSLRKAREFLLASKFWWQGATAFAAVVLCAFLLFMISFAALDRLDSAPIAAKREANAKPTLQAESQFLDRTNEDEAVENGSTRAAVSNASPQLNINPAPKRKSTDAQAMAARAPQPISSEPKSLFAQKKQENAVNIATKQNNVRRAKIEEVALPEEEDGAPRLSDLFDEIGAG